MNRSGVLARRIYEEAQDLPEASLLELARYVAFLRFKAKAHHPLQEQLASDYDSLATLYGELATELADEVWLPAENEALLRAERDRDS